MEAGHATTVGGLGPRGLARALAGDLDAVLARSLAHAPEERYGSAEAFGADLDRFLALQPVTARRMSRLSRLRKFVRRHRMGVGLGAMVVLATLAGVIGVLHQARETSRAARRAEATKDFLVEVFKASDPRVAQDRPRGAITARELLDTAASRIDTRLREDPETRGEMLVLLATIYTYLRRARHGQAARCPRAHGDAPAHGARRSASHRPARVRGMADARGPAHADAAPLLAALDQRLTEQGLDDGRHRAEWHLATSDLHAARGEQAARERSLLAAVALYARAAPRDSGHEAALSNLGQMAFARGELERAQDLLDRALAVALRATSEPTSRASRLAGAGCCSSSTAGRRPGPPSTTRSKGIHGRWDRITRRPGPRMPPAPG